MTSCCPLSPTDIIPGALVSSVLWVGSRFHLTRFYTNSTKSGHNFYYFYLVSSVLWVCSMLLPWLSARLKSTTLAFFPPLLRLRVKALWSSRHRLKEKEKNNIRTEFGHWRPWLGLISKGYSTGIFLCQIFTESRRKLWLSVCFHLPAYRTVYDLSITKKKQMVIAGSNKTFYCLEGRLHN